jgi:hypothetical protein
LIVLIPRKTKKPFLIIKQSHNFQCFEKENRKVAISFKKTITEPPLPNFH